MDRDRKELTFVRTGREIEKEFSLWARWRARLRATVIWVLYPLVSLFEAPKPSRTSLRVILYHHVFDDQRENFRSQLAYLSSRFDFVDIGEFLELLSGRKELRGRKLLFTFDDGFKDNITNALPILEEFGIKAVFFVSTGFVSLTEKEVEKHWHYAREVFHVGRPVENLSWSDVTELARRGHTVGSHTTTHRQLSNLSAAEVARELNTSRSVLEQKSGRPVMDMSFPYGRRDDYRPDLTDLARRAGYRSCFNMIRGENLPGQDPYFINRDALEAGWPLIQVKFFMKKK